MKIKLEMDFLEACALAAAATVVLLQIPERELSVAERDCLAPLAAILERLNARLSPEGRAESED